MVPHRPTGDPAAGWPDAGAPLVCDGSSPSFPSSFRRPRRLLPGPGAPSRYSAAGQVRHVHISMLSSSAGTVDLQWNAGLLTTLHITQWATTHAAEVATRPWVLRAVGPRGQGRATYGWTRDRNVLLQAAGQRQDRLSTASQRRAVVVGRTGSAALTHGLVAQPLRHCCRKGREPPGADPLVVIEVHGPAGEPPYLRGPGRSVPIQARFGQSL